jgi:hypothetical protein
MALPWGWLNLTAVRRVGTWPASGTRIIAAGLIGLGLVFRLGRYFAGRSLWFDEALLAMNISARSFRGLLGTLNDDQGAPAGFLLVEKLLIQSLGNTDFVLRIVPLLAGCTTLLLLYWLADEMMPGLPALFALAACVVTEPMIYYSSELKQYAGDAVIVLALYLVAVRHLARPATGRQFLLLAAAGAAAVVFSLPAVFVLGAIGITLLIHYLILKDWGRMGRLALAGLAWAATFLVLYLVVLQGLAANSSLTRYWQGSFMPLPLSAVWLKEALLAMFDNPAGLPYPYLAAALCITGLVSVFIRRWQWGLLLLIPIMLTLSASALQKYPFGARLILFLAPNLFLLIGEGLERVRALCEQGLFLLVRQPARSDQVSGQ